MKHTLSAPDLLGSYFIRKTNRSNPFCEFVKENINHSSGKYTIH